MLQLLKKDFFKCPECTGEEIAYNLDTIACMRCPWTSPTSAVPPDRFPAPMAAMLAASTLGYSKSKVFYLRRDGEADSASFLSTASQRMLHLLEIDAGIKIADEIAASVISKTGGLPEKFVGMGGYCTGGYGINFSGVSLTEKRPVSASGIESPEAGYFTKHCGGALGVGMDSMARLGSWTRMAENGASDCGAWTIRVYGPEPDHASMGIHHGMAAEMEVLGEGTAWAIAKIFRYNMPSTVIAGVAQVSGEKVTRINFRSGEMISKRYFSSNYPTVVHDSMEYMSIVDSAIPQPVHWGAIDISGGDSIPRYFAHATDPGSSRVATFFYADGPDGQALKASVANVGRQEAIAVRSIPLPQAQGDPDSVGVDDGDVEAAADIARGLCVEWGVEIACEKIWDYGERPFLPIWDIRMDDRVWDNPEMLVRMASR